MVEDEKLLDFMREKKIITCSLKIQNFLFGFRPHKDGLGVDGLGRPFSDENTFYMTVENAQYLINTHEKINFCVNQKELEFAWNTFDFPNEEVEIFGRGLKFSFRQITDKFPNSKSFDITDCMDVSPEGIVNPKRIEKLCAGGVIGDEICDFTKFENLQEFCLKFKGKINDKCSGKIKLPRGAAFKSIYPEKTTVTYEDLSINVADINLESHHDLEIQMMKIDAGSRVSRRSILTTLTNSYDIHGCESFTVKSVKYFGFSEELFDAVLRKYGKTCETLWAEKLDVNISALNQKIVTDLNVRKITGVGERDLLWKATSSFRTLENQCMSLITSWHAMKKLTIANTGPDADSFDANSIAYNMPNLEEFSGKMHFTSYGITFANLKILQTFRLTLFDQFFNKSEFPVLEALALTDLREDYPSKSDLEFKSRNFPALKFLELSIISRNNAPRIKFDGLHLTILELDVICSDDYPLVILDGNSEMDEIYLHSEDHGDHDEIIIAKSDAIVCNCIEDDANLFNICGDYVLGTESKLYSPEEHVVIIVKNDADNTVPFILATQLKRADNSVFSPLELAMDLNGEGKVLRALDFKPTPKNKVYFSSTESFDLIPLRPEEKENLIEELREEGEDFNRCVLCAETSTEETIRNDEFFLMPGCATLVHRNCLQNVIIAKYPDAANIYGPSIFQCPFCKDSYEKLIANSGNRSSFRSEVYGKGRKSKIQ